MNLIEHWGSGIPRIMSRVKAAGLAEPEFIGGEVDLRINIYRNQINGIHSLQHSVGGAETAGKLPGNRRKTAGKLPGNRRETAGKLPTTEQEQKIHKYVFEKGSITTAQATELLGVKQRRAREILGKMVENRWLRREGASRTTVYVMNTERG